MTASPLAGLPGHRVTVWKEDDYNRLTDMTWAFTNFLNTNVANVCMIGDQWCKNRGIPEGDCYFWTNPMWETDVVWHESLVALPDVRVEKMAKNKLGIHFDPEMSDEYIADITRVGKVQKSGGGFEFVVPKMVPRKQKKPKLWIHPMTAPEESAKSVWGDPSRFGDLFEACKDRFAVAPLNFLVNMESDDADDDVLIGHANFVVFDLSKKPIHVERFEPHGAETSLLTHEHLDDQLQDFLRDVPQIGGAFRYFAPAQWCPFRGIQTIENDPACADVLRAVMEPGTGFCRTWAFLYAYLRVQPQFADLRRGQLMKKMNDAFRADPAGQCKHVAEFLEYLKRTVRR